ncbi:MAG: hypothetical protein WDZ59_03555 [Pirellulales bacterium]
MIKSIDVLSLGRVLGLLYAGLGVLIGGFFSLITMAGAVAGGGQEGLIAAFFGVGAIIFFPVFYGVMGFVGGVITAALYNFIASVAGGIELELQ